jgi:rifampicin phosphotransferase
VNADVHKVRDGKIIDKRISAKTSAIHALDAGGTAVREIGPEKRNGQALTDEQALRLERLGRKIEAHFGRPQDIEWCLADDAFQIVQSRPITALYPIPEANDRENRVYISVGHGQMMTDPMKTLGLSFFLLTTRAPMRTAGGRLFVDVTKILASTAGRRTVLETMGKSDPLIKDALMTIAERGDFIESLPAEKDQPGPGKVINDAAPAELKTHNGYDPAIVPDLIKSSRESIEVLRLEIQAKSGLELMDFILEDIQELKKSLFDPRSIGVIMAAMDASAWINGKMKEWLGETGAADALSQSVPGNVTSEMGLELLDVADAIRPYPEIIEYLRHAKDEGFLDGLDGFEGGQAAKDAIHAYLDRYGMRCAGEIDITRARWSERPATLAPIILSNVKNLEPGAGHRKFERGRLEALEKERELLHRVARLPDGEEKAKETKRKIDLIRDSSGYREYPKYGMVNRYFIYRQALLKEAERLVESGLIHEKEDIYHLSFEELREAVRANRFDNQLIRDRKVEFGLFGKLTPPRVITSDGEIITGEYKRENLPAGAMAGLPVSSGVVEGRARVILKMEDADLENGDILVTPFTDPGWTALFVSIKGLVTEVGGLMTHGAVIAREYGLPAVVGVENATKLIKDGQRIRVHGTDGFVEILPP